MNGVFALGLMNSIGSDLTDLAVLNAYLLSDEYEPNFLTHAALSSVDSGAIIAGPEPVSGAAVGLGGHLLITDNTFFPGIGPFVDHVRAVLLVHDIGPQFLLSYADRRADTRLIDVVTVGDDVDVVWSPYGAFNI